MDAVAADCWYCHEPVGSDPVSDSQHKCFCDCNCRLLYYALHSQKKCTFCKDELHPIIYIRHEERKFCSKECLIAHMTMMEMDDRRGFIACFYHKIMVISRYVYRLIK